MFYRKVSMLLRSLFISLIITVISSCGRSPLQLEKNQNENAGNVNLEVPKKFSSINQTLEIIWLSPRNIIEASHFLLITKKNQVAYDLPDNYKIQLWMPSMGHGSSPLLVNKIATGVYDVSEVYFIMSGDWQIKVQLLEGSKTIEEINFNYDIL